jgi:RecA-family ATPase
VTIPENPPDNDDLEPLETYPWSEILKLPKREILIPDLAFTTGVTTVVAESGGGKTTLISSAVWTAAIGGLWAGKLIKPQPVIWVAGEGQYDLGPIYEAWMKEHPGCPELGGRFMIEPIDLSSGRQTDRLIKLVKSMDPPMVVTDALADMLGALDESKNKDMQQIYKNVWRVVGANQASFLPHHSGWDNSRERGATTIRAKSDIVVQIVKYDPVAGFIEFKHHKRRGGAKRRSSLSANKAASH